jgi:hypothetical protein
LYFPETDRKSPSDDDPFDRRGAEGERGAPRSGVRRLRADVKGAAAGKPRERRARRPREKDDGDRRRRKKNRRPAPKGQSARRQRGRETAPRPGQQRPQK